MKLYFHILFTTFVPQPCKKSIGKGKNAIVVEQRFLGFLYRRCTTAIRKVHDQREYDSSDRKKAQGSVHPLSRISSLETCYRIVRSHEHNRIANIVVIINWNQIFLDLFIFLCYF